MTDSGAIEQLWAEFAHDPQAQALAVALHCVKHTPHLAASLAKRIADSMPMRARRPSYRLGEPRYDARLIALLLLARCHVSQTFNTDTPTQLRLPEPQPEDSVSIRRDEPSSTDSIRRGEPLCSPDHADRHMGLSLRETRKQGQNLIRVDWELGRLAIALDLAAPFRLWLLACEVTRRAGGSGVVSRRDLWQMAQEFGVDFGKRHFNRLLARGGGLFWFSQGDNLYLVGIQKLAGALTILADEQRILTVTNMPGVRQVMLDVSGSHEQWEAMLYAGWIAGRSQKKQENAVTIARDTLSQLFARHEVTLRRWEKARLKDIINVRHNSAQHVLDDDLDAAIDLPAHTQPYLARVRTSRGITYEVRLCWQIANTYESTLNAYPHQGQASKVRKAANSTRNPADDQCGGQVRLYYRDAKALKQHMRSKRLRMGQAGDPTRRVYAFIGVHRRSRRGVFEFTNHDLPITRPYERVHPRQESDYFSHEGARQRAAWRSRQDYILLTEC